MNSESSDATVSNEKRGPSPRRFIALLLVAGVLILSVAFAGYSPRRPQAELPSEASMTPAPPFSGLQQARPLNSLDHLTVWWENAAPGLEQRLIPTGDKSNIHPTDYAGPDS